MSELIFKPEDAIGKRLLEKDKQELLQFVARLCLHLKAEVGSRAWRGGIFPDNICESETDEFAIGPAKTEKWTGQELEFVAPELYWHGETSPAADVYSLGLLLYYGLGEGRLPFETATSSGQLARMSGKVLPAPRCAGKRLAEVMEKATAFQTADRYQTPEELQIMLESCMDNKYLAGKDGASTVFGKPEGELSEIERMMVEIMESGEEPASEPEVPPEPPSEDLSLEERAGLERPEPIPVEKENVSELVEEFFGSLSDKDTQERQTARTDGSDPEEAEDVRVYEPTHEKKDRQPIPILTEEKNPELAPVVLRQQPRFSRNMTDPAQQQKVAEEVKTRRSRRPLFVVLGLCVLLVIGAVVAKPFLEQSMRSRRIAANAGNPTPDPTLVQDDTVYLIPDQQGNGETAGQVEETFAPLPRYEIVLSDMTWTQAQAACLEQGGYLAVISSQAELDEITKLAEEQGIYHLWIGCRRIDRENDVYAWENGEQARILRWADGEPSYEWGGMAEDYIMLDLEENGWVYNDNSNDPANTYPNRYHEQMGYVLERNP
jgi:hypothetical protein